MKTNENENRKNYYRAKQEALRDEAIEWQTMLWDNGWEAGATWENLVEKPLYFEEMGRKYGLLGEFRENGIC